MRLNPFPQESDRLGDTFVDDRICRICRCSGKDQNEIDSFSRINQIRNERMMLQTPGFPGATAYRISVRCMADFARRNGKGDTDRVSIVVPKLIMNTERESKKCCGLPEQGFNAFATFKPLFSWKGVRLVGSIQ